MTGYLASNCSFGLLCVSPSLMQTVADTPSSPRLAPQPPPSGPKLVMNSLPVSAVVAVQQRNTEIGMMAGNDLIRDRLATSP